MDNKKQMPLKLIPAVVHKEIKHKIVLSEKLETKIRTFCALSPNREWSGVMFYKFEGDFDNGITIRANDMYLMDQGTQAHTEFDLNEPEITRYMVFEGLTDHCISLIHSHNQMQAFFSGEDTSTLTQYGTEMNNFVSMVVNNAGDYVARVTRKVSLNGIRESVITGEMSYPIFNTGRSKSRKFTNKESKELTDQWIEFFDLDIEKPEINVEDSIFRFGEVNHKCSSVAVKTPSFSTAPKDFKDWNQKEPTLFDNTEEIEYDEEVYSPEELELPPIDGLAFASHGYYDWIKKLIYGTPFYSNPDNRLNVKLISSLYKEAFPEKKDFANWFDFWLDYMVSVFDLNWIEETEYDAEDLLLSKLYRQVYSMSDLRYRNEILKIIEARLM